MNTGLASSKTNNTPSKSTSVDPYLHRFCWHLYFGICRQVEPDRISAYARFFYAEYLHSFMARRSALAARNFLSDDAVKKMQAHHRKINRLFDYSEPTYRVFGQIEDKLDEYIRFDKRVLQEFQRNGVTGQDVSAHWYDVNNKLATWEDKFWELESPQHSKRILL